MAVRFQLVIDCADPEPLARFWAAALGYVLEPPPDGFASWDAYWRDLGVPEDELGGGADRIVDPRAGAADLVPGGTGAQSGQEPAAHRYRRQRRPRGSDRDAQAARRRGGGPSGRSRCPVRPCPREEGLDHYAVAMQDPEGNEFDIN